MRVEIVSFTGDSGLADYAVSLGRSLSAFARVRVVTARALSPRFNHMGFEVDRVFRRSRHYPIDILRFLFKVLRRRPDWLMVQGPLKFAFVDALVFRVLRLFGIRMAVTVHDVLPHYPRVWSRHTFGFYYRSFSRVVVHSAAAAEGVRRLGVTVRPLIVPHGIYDIFDLSGIDRESARARVGGLQRDHIVVLFFGHLEPRKGLMEFLDSAELMKDEQLFRFVVAGGSSLASHGAHYVDRLEAAKSWPNVIVHDRRIPFEEVENYFAGSDIVALPYLEGTTSGVLKLALAFGKPVIATRVGDFPEQVPRGAGEFIDLNGQVAESFADALRKMAADYATYADSMRRARASAGWPDIAARLHAYLENQNLA